MQIVSARSTTENRLRPRLAAVQKKWRPSSPGSTTLDHTAGPHARRIAHLTSSPFTCLKTATAGCARLRKSAPRHSPADTHCALADHPENKGLLQALQRQQQRTRNGSCILRTLFLYAELTQRMIDLIQKTKLYDRYKGQLTGGKISHDSAVMRFQVIVAELLINGASPTTTATSDPLARMGASAPQKHALSLKHRSKMRCPWPSDEFFGESSIAAFSSSPAEDEHCWTSKCRR
jgi:hypothetical protein